MRSRNYPKKAAVDAAGFLAVLISRIIAGIELREAIAIAYNFASLVSQLACLFIIRQGESNPIIRNRYILITEQFNNINN
jgi:hypothetical protein